MIPFLFTYCLIFGWKLYSFDITILSALFFALFACTPPYEKIFLKKTTIILIVVLLIFSFNIVASLNNHGDIIRNINEFGKPIFYFFAAAGLFKYFVLRFKDKASYELYKCIMHSIFVSSLIILLFFFLGSIRMHVYSLCDLYILQKHGFENMEHRISDPSIGGSTVSYLFAFGYTSLLFIQKNLKSKLYPNAKYIYLACTAAAAFLTARTGFLLIILSSGIYLLCNKKKVLMIALFIFIFMQKFLLRNKNIIIDLLEQSPISMWAFEGFINLLDYGIFETSSSNYILDQFHYNPANISQFLFGSGAIKNLESDSLFVFILTSNGLLGFISILCMLFFFFYVLHHLKKTSYFNSFIIFACLFIIGNLKENFFGNARGAIILFLLFQVLALNSIEQSKIEKTNIS